MPNCEKFFVAGQNIYQPPRQPAHNRLEGKSTQEVDWNLKITRECYSPQIREGTLDLASFDFYATIRKMMPSLLNQEETTHLKETMRSRGVGDSFLHVLLPDLDKRDKEILIKAGQNAFKEDVGATPQWFWPPESALDNATLEVLAEAGYLGVLCAPEQISGLDGPADNHPIILDLENGNHILALPFDRPVSSELGNGDKSNADKFAEKLIIPRIKDLTPSLPMISWTDGETFGHHVPFANLFINYLLTVSLPNAGIGILNINDITKVWLTSDYRSGKLNQRTAWSCPHGNLIRWHGACPCDEGKNGAWKTHYCNALSDFNQQITLLLDQELGKAWPEKLAANFTQAIYHKGSNNSEMSLLAAKASSLEAQTSCPTFFNNPLTSGKINLLFARQSLENLKDAGQTLLAKKLQQNLIQELSKGIDPYSGQDLVTIFADCFN